MSSSSVSFVYLYLLHLDNRLVSNVYPRPSHGIVVVSTGAVIPTRDDGINAIRPVDVCWVEIRRVAEAIFRIRQLVRRARFIRLLFLVRSAQRGQSDRIAWSADRCAAADRAEEARGQNQAENRPEQRKTS